MIYIYRLFYFILKSLLILSSPFLAKKAKAYLKLRNSKKYQVCTAQNAIWFHASSGEIEYCKSVISELRKTQPHQKIIISYSSPSAEKLLFNIKQDVDFIFPLTWDSTSAVSELLDHLNPIALVFSRTDFWPELIFLSQKRNIPTMAISMFPRFNPINNLIYRWLLKKFTLITCVNQATATQLSKILDAQVLTVLDTRFDQVFNRLNSPSRILFSENIKRIVFASTWTEDENQIIPTFNKLITLGYQIIMCPHEVSRAPELKSRLHDFEACLLSEIVDTTNPPLKINSAVKILIIDRVGFLADIYRYSEFAFVGGSFKKRIHSVMEPLCCNNIVLFGPHINNNPEAVESLKLGLTYQVHSSSDIVQFLETFIGQSTIELKNRIKNFADSHRGASLQITQEILTRLADQRK